MTNDQMRNWQQCHPGCNCPDCETMMAAAVGLARDMYRRMMANAGIRVADLDASLGALLHEPENVRLLHDNPPGFVVGIFEGVSVQLAQLAEEGGLPDAIN